MSGYAIQLDALKALVSQQATREAVVGGMQGDNSKWTLSVRLGAPTARLVAVRSRREPVRTWASLTAVGRFAEAVGIAVFSVEL
ncbi:hypothetical protein CCU68_29370 [Pseudomonas gingeri NCPPB 3146 = LMG 5327]|uniref:Uncharacterized protein n=2 Tax=Pseudomonas gingeri TaxID=117681 RepID=A0A7Y7Y3R5_9PSED|nr:hypothetical protein [Pseudomonas gingeri]NWC16177.1 hypothetical protein [Pseudomonas gingeri]PNQ89019.1 hypothetical protein CCU68_29370 [Pseudomonas gingeri NCPPB 3146 = LMG 5327]